MAAIDVVVLTYLPQLALARCVESVLPEGDVRVLVAVNNEPALVAPVLAPLAAKWHNDPVTFLNLGRNWGYAAGLNRALASITAPLVLLLNDDAWLTPGALTEMVQAMGDAGDWTAAVVPKLLLGDSDKIDCVGAAILANGWVANHGYGDRDEGQYDQVEEVAGACFAAVLVRREALDDVGPLWAPFFMYAEDADWCLRARLAGWRFVTCPKAVVRHGHSVSTATLPATWKARQIRRNSMLVVVRCFPPKRALALSFLHLWEDLRGRWPQTGSRLTVVGPFLRLLPAALAERRRIRGLARTASVDAELSNARRNEEGA